MKTTGHTDIPKHILYYFHSLPTADQNKIYTEDDDNIYKERNRVITIFLETTNKLNGYYNKFAWICTSIEKNNPQYTKLIA